MRSLWISMHGGGGAPARVNDQQWQNQIRLYQPEEGIYVAPRAPTDTWNLWHQDHIDPLFDRLIENMVALRGVSPDRIYLMGYSAGGDGVWQLAPRMADRFAAAAMMAGHPNESSLLGLRNLPFGIFMGENDAAYERNTVAAEKSAELAALHKADPGGYTHLTRIYPGLGHWMDLKCAEALPWMAQYQRNPWPKKIVWLQDDVVHHRFYWLRLPEGTAVVNRKITAHIEGRTIRLEGDVPPGTEILLSDALIDLDDAVTVSVNDTPAFTITPQRTLATIRAALGDRLDPVATPTATIRIP
jgi:predicted esterase